jgi:hypothetical protein
MITFMVNEDRSALLPVNSAARSALAEREPGEGVAIEFPQSRAHSELRKRVFAALGRVAKAVGIDAEQLRAIMLIRTGRCHVIGVPGIGENGEEKIHKVIVINSMARQFMDEDELRAFWKDVREILASLLSQEERAVIAPMLDGS